MNNKPKRLSHEELKKLRKPIKNINVECRENRGGRVCLDSLKQFLSGKLLCLMPLPATAVV